MSSYGLKDYGMLIPSYEEWREEYYDKARTTLGSDINVGNSSVVGQFLSIFAFQDMITWQALQAVYNSQTYDGAEGIYLDEILSRRGVFRKSSSPGNGFAFVQTNNNALWTTTIPTTTSFSASNSLNYKTSVQTALRDRIAAFSVTKTQLTSMAPSITFSIHNATTGGLNTITLATNSNTVLSDLAAFLSSNVLTGDTNKVFVNGSTLYLGFEQTDLINPIGLIAPVKFYASVSVGVKWSLVPVEATTEGIYELFPGGINGISPTIPGLISVGNFTEFYAGRDVETDAEYRSRFNDTIDEANAATRPAIYKAISDLDGVEKVRIYDNPTMTDTEEAPAFTFNTVVLGGETSAIAQTLYEKKPINTLTSGTVSYNIILPDGGIEVIRYTPATEINYSFKIRYATIDGLPLTQEEQNKILNNIVNLSASFNMGTKVFNVQLQSVVFSSIDFGKLSFLEVLSKPSVDNDSQYSTSDILPGYSEIIRVSAANISFEQIV